MAGAAAARTAILSWVGGRDVEHGQRHRALRDHLHDRVDGASRRELVRQRGALAVADDEDLRVAIITQVTRTAPHTLQAVLASGQSLQLQGDGLKLARPGLGPKAPAALAPERLESLAPEGPS